MKRSILAFVILSTVASAINYATYPVLGRVLPADQYVNITVSLSLLTQITTFLSSIIAITIGLSKSESHKNVNSKIEFLQSSVFRFFVILDLIFLALSPMIMQKINTPTIFALPISLMMLVSIPIAVISGYLNGKGLMTKLGMVAVVSAGLQFLSGVVIGLVTKNGLIVMLFMTLAQIITIAIIYRLFTTDNLPQINKILKAPIDNNQQYIKKLLSYTLFASVAIMLINLVQIADLLVIKSLHGNDIKFYTDIYVISRVVFFAGMIFTWPFLSEISIDSHYLNRKPFTKAVAYFSIISLGAILSLYLFGSSIAKALFGAEYGVDIIRTTGILSVLFKLFFLIITSVILYFVVLRSYIAVWLSVLITGAILLYSELVSDNASINSVLTSLDWISGLVAALSICLLIFRPIKKNDT